MVTTNVLCSANKLTSTINIKTSPFKLDYLYTTEVMAGLAKIMIALSSL